MRIRLNIAIPYFDTKITEGKGGKFQILGCRGDFTDPVLRVAMEYYVLSLCLTLYSTSANSKSGYINETIYE
jgi:hypothetical protein